MSINKRKGGANESWWINFAEINEVDHTHYKYCWRIYFNERLSNATLKFYFENKEKPVQLFWTGFGCYSRAVSKTSTRWVLPYYNESLASHFIPTCNSARLSWIGIIQTKEKLGSQLTQLGCLKYYQELLLDRVNQKLSNKPR